MAAEQALVVQNEYIDRAQREQQLVYDLRTQFAELVNGNMRTEFRLEFDGRDLIGEDGRGMSEVTRVAINDAERIAEVNPELSFEVRRRNHENDELVEAIEMAQGRRLNTSITVSDFPPELAEATEDVGGYNVSRKQTMLRVLTVTPDGNVQMYSQSLDGSNRRALEAIYAKYDLKPEQGELLGQRISVDIPTEEQHTLIDELTGVYDRDLTAQFGGEWYAGRRPADYRNTYDFVCAQQDLVEECIRLDGLGWLTDSFMYDVAAEMNRRFKLAPANTAAFTINTTDIATLHQMVTMAGTEARSMGVSFSACGVTLKADGAEGSLESQLEQAGFGNQSAEDKYGSLTFKCQKGHTNTRPRNKLIDKCTTCGVSVKC